MILLKLSIKSITYYEGMILLKVILLKNGVLYDLEKNLNYPLKATVKLNFRIYPQWVTSIVQKAFPELPNPPVVELENIEQIFKK